LSTDGPIEGLLCRLGGVAVDRAAAIRAVYLALLKKYHPDVYKSGKDEATRRTKELNEAYTFLCDEKHLEKYDSLRADFCSKSGEYKKQNNEKTINKDIDTYWQSYGDPGTSPRQIKAKATNYRDPWHASLQGADRLRVFVVGIVVSVARILDGDALKTQPAVTVMST
jgi:curved DNA-binding protein CbpA